jgi:hypothetical protein
MAHWASTFMNGIFATLMNRKTLGEGTSNPNSSTQSSLQLTSLCQVFCQSCLELDGRCTARLIWAPKVTARAVRAEPRSLQLHRNFAELERCGERGCYPCRLWASVLLRECYSDDVVASLRKSSHPILALPPVAVTWPWIITVSAQTFTGESLTGRAALQDSPYVPGPGKICPSEVRQNC